MMGHVEPRGIVLTAVALVCFAGNSLLCRLALAERHVDAATFTAVRLASGALTLAVLAMGRQRPARATGAKWTSGALLFAYAAPFSFAYLKLGAAIGALILFASVQATMVGWGVLKGERPNALAWLGIVVALGGLVALTIPGRSAPDPLGAFAMAAAGMAWGGYSLRGRTTEGDPVVTTATAFARALPLGVALMAVAATGAVELHATTRGVALAALSGAIASGVGYSVWYAALRHLTATRAAVLQLLVPILAAGGAVLVLGEGVTARLLGAAAAIIGGVALTIAAKTRAAERA
jgi:drug/metabolite transporter (DMT)-like permease